MVNRQVKSKKRVADHGEVFTAEREINAMLDLVRQETERIDSRFLEPACGDGNFLAEILRRKLDVVKKKYRRSPIDYEKNSILAASSIYGVDILIDNVKICRERMFDIWDSEYKKVCKKEVNDDCRKTARFIFERNIICGNALSLKQVDDQGVDLEEPIIFSEWSFVTGFNLQRSDYRFDKLLEGTEKARDIFELEESVENENEVSEQIELFSNSLIEDKGITVEQKNDVNEEGELIQQYIDHYRRVWAYGN